MKRAVLRLAMYLATEGVPMRKRIMLTVLLMAAMLLWPFIVLRRREK